MSQQLPVPTQHPMIRVFSDEQVQAIHFATLEILEKTGVEMQNPQGRDLLLAAGAWESGGRIKMPERLVTQALATAPSRIHMYDQSGNLTMPLELGKVFYGSGSDATFTLDLETGERRKATAQDVENFACLADSLDNIDFVMSMSNPSDVPPDDVYIHEFIGMIRGSAKPIVYTVKDYRDLEDIYQVGVAVAGSEQTLREKPFFLLYPEPISPLLMPEDTLQKIIFCAEHWLPTGFIPSTNTGGGGPITLAGAIALGNAECLVGLVITQLVQPGAPFLYGYNTSTLDMKTSIVSYGCPEWSLSMAAISDLARFYGLPVWGYAGASDSKTVDAQYGAEAAFSIMSAMLSQTTLVHDVGFIEFGYTSSLEALVIADEIIRMTRFTVSGIDINKTTLALDAIARARPGGGFLADDHTLDNWKWAQWRPDIIDRSRYESWVKSGKKDMFTRANERAREILATHEVPPLPEEAEAVIAEVMAERHAAAT
jgi:trimethylamine--corrinoid protein Co-methyltransferase